MPDNSTPIPHDNLSPMPLDNDRMTPEEFVEELLLIFGPNERPDVEERKYWLEVAERLTYEQGQHLYHAAVFVTRTLNPKN